MDGAPFVAIFLLFVTTTRSAIIGLEGCAESKSCWAQPPGCQDNCVSAATWIWTEAGFSITLSASVSDLDPSRPYWLALGFSHNQRMDDDTVFECLMSQDGTRSIAQISFNDETANHALPQASSVMLGKEKIELVDGILSCTLTYYPDNRSLVYPDDQYKLHQLDAKPYYLLLARGSADPYTYSKDIHFMNDGPLFPWISGEQADFCRSNCSGPQFVRIDSGLQSHVERYWRYRIAVFHGCTLMFGWWVLVSNGILLARFFKPMWPRRRFFGVAVWFQLHRGLNIISLCLQLIAVLLIFYQSGWVWYECSYECDLQALAKKMHAMIGGLATVLAILNPMIALARPAPDSSTRPFFNWLHWGLGLGGWGCASLTILLSVPLGKTGLYAAYGPIPFYIMCSYLLFFVAINIALQIVTTSHEARQEKAEAESSHRFVVGHSGMALSIVNGPATVIPASKPTKSTCPLFLLLLHVVISMVVVIGLTALLLKSLWSHSP